MITRLLLGLLIMLPLNLKFEDLAEAQAPNQLTFRADINYVPTGSIDLGNTSSSYTIYDNVFYRFSGDYPLYSILSIGPSFEIMKKRIEPSAIYHDDISVYSFYLDLRVNYLFIESGKSLFVLGAGSGMSSLHEGGSGSSDNGFTAYGLVGFDLPLYSNLGLDLAYRYQTAHFKIGAHEYKFDGSALQAGLNYRIGL
jgi:hypothetical protein